MISTYYKEAGLAALTALLGLGALWAGNKQGLFSLSTLGLILVFAVCYGLGAILMNSLYWKWLGLGIPFAASFYFLPLNQWTYAWVFAGFISAALGWWEISKQRDFTFLFGVRRILRSGLPSLFTGMAILAALFYYTTSAQKENVVILPRSVFDISFPYIAKGLAGVISAGISLDKDRTVNELLLDITKPEIGPGIDIKSLPPAKINSFLAEARNNLSQQLGTHLGGGERLGDVFYDLIGRKSAEFTKPYEAYMPLIYTIAVFLTVKGIFLPIYWLTLLIASLLFTLGRKTGVIQESASSVPATKYSL
ncbi:MAG: hypothetical protein HYT39_00025 [Candidatus Sungbacteria bacterium]|nr:hypothetical protein [Candidatus Sungbacteria bacterium]